MPKKTILCGYTIMDANGGGDLLISIGNSVPYWICSYTASKLLGKFYVNNEQISDMIDADYDLAMSQVFDL